MVKKYRYTGYKSSQEIKYKEYSYTQFFKLIEKEKDTINLYDKNTSIAKSNDSEGTFWFITYKKKFGRREVIKVNGITGELLERSHYPHEDNWSKTV